MLTSEGHIFDQELAIHLLEVPCPMFYFVLKTISINKECLEVQNMNGPTSLDLKKLYINLGAKKLRVRFLRVTPHDL